MTSTRPTVLINFAITADGKVSTAQKEPAHFTSKRDLQRLWEIRERADTILINHGTLEANSISMTIPPELKPSHQPLHCVISHSGTFNVHHTANSRNPRLRPASTIPFETADSPPRTTSAI